MKDSPASSPVDTTDEARTVDGYGAACITTEPAVSLVYIGRFTSSWEYFGSVVTEEPGRTKFTPPLRPLHSTGQTSEAPWHLLTTTELLILILDHSRAIFARFYEAWSYLWRCWLEYASLHEGYFYSWWYCMLLEPILYLLYPIWRSRGIGVSKWILFIWACHLLVFPITRTVYPGLKLQVRNGLRHVHDACWHMIQILKAKVQSIKLELSKGILLLLGEGYEFEKDKLVQLWMATGLIEYEPKEIHAANYFENLISKGYILPSNSILLYKMNSEKVKTYLDKIRGSSNYMRLEGTRQSNAHTAEILHVSVEGDYISDSVFRTLSKFKRLRTLLFYGSRIERVPRDLFVSFESLLVLDLSRANMKEVPSSAMKMIHLRYLDLSRTLIEVLPETVSRFQRLQTLKLIGCSHLWRLPKEMKRLTELRHLDFDVLGKLSVMPMGMGVLVSLRTLSAFIVGTQEGCKITELRDLNNLMGELCIARLEHVENAHDAEVASLSAKKHLKKLELRWSDFPLQERENQNVDASVLENLYPHSDLEELVIRCYGGIEFPRWVGGEPFKKLVSITLFKCEHVSVLPFMQKLPSLEYLGLISLNSVMVMDFRGELDVAFPKVQRLIIDEMLNLNTWLEGVEGDFPCLAELTIKHCPKLPQLPSLVFLSTLKRLEISSCRRVQFADDKEVSTSLEFLIVEKCPLMEKSCLKEEGKDWGKIKHVPNVWIDQEAILDDDDSNCDKDCRETDDDDDDDDDDEEELPLTKESSLKVEGKSLDDLYSTEPVTSLGYDLWTSEDEYNLSFIVGLLLPFTV